MNNKDNSTFALVAVTAAMLAATLLIMPNNAGAETKSGNSNKKPNSTFIAGKNADVCLSKILYSEGRGESIEGVIALGEATVARAKRTGTTICKVKGVTRKQPPKRLAHYWITLAKTILNDKQSPITKGADSWNQGKKPAFKGDMKRLIGKHIFYTMADM